MHFFTNVFLLLWLCSSIRDFVVLVMFLCWCSSWAWSYIFVGAFCCIDRDLLSMFFALGHTFLLVFLFSIGVICGLGHIFFIGVLCYFGHIFVLMFLVVFSILCFL